MKMSVVTIEEKDNILIISKKNYPFINILKSELVKKGCDVFFSSQNPSTNGKTIFQYCFYINQKPINNPEIKNSIAIFINQQKNAEKLRQSHEQNTKIVNIAGNNIDENHVDRILWFSFSKSHEKYFSFTVSTLATPHHANISLSKFHHHFLPHITPKKIVLTLLLFIFLFHFLFIPPLLLSLFRVYKSYKLISQEQFAPVKKQIQFGLSDFQTAKNLYAIVKPTYALFSVSLFPDRLFDIADKSLTIFAETLKTLDSTKEITKGILNKNKSKEETAMLQLRIDTVKKSLTLIEDQLTTLQKSIPALIYKNIPSLVKLNEILDGIAKTRKIMNYSDTLLANDSEKKYLLFFENNMEIRPGGGFIGSFGVVTLKNFTFEDLKIYDVYDADGQLTAHIEPPLPIKKYLNMSHLFLRDSNNSPDFSENYTLAKFFLEKEVNMTDFSGASVVTTSAIESLLDAYGDVYLPDFSETINKQNFYLKTQMHVENDFFPGSTQKKTYLSALVKQLLINLENASVKKLALSLKKSFDEKQIVFISEDTEVQKIIDSLYWSGRVIEPKCTTKINNCMVDYLLPYDFNVGPNKVNYFVKRSISQKVNIRPDGSIKNLFSLNFQNEATQNQFPGGLYRDYFQLLLPPNIIINQITNNGTLVENVEKKSDKFTTIGFYLEVEPQKSTEIKIAYSLPAIFKKGKGVYQLIVQKQIGSGNSDIAFEMQLPNNVFLQNQNFSPLVKDREIVYNTTLSADKIFFVELSKE